MGLQNGAKPVEAGFLWFLQVRLVPCCGSIFNAAEMEARKETTGIETARRRKMAWRSESFGSREKIYPLVGERSVDQRDCNWLTDGSVATRLLGPPSRNSEGKKLCVGLEEFSRLGHVFFFFILLMIVSSSFVRALLTFVLENFRPARRITFNSTIDRSTTHRPSCASEQLQLSTSSGFMKVMGIYKASSSSILFFLLGLVALEHCCGIEPETVQPSRLVVDASPQSARRIPDTLFGIFFEEINHAGAGGLWAELVSNRGFEAGGPSTPSNIDPWSVIGDESAVIISTDRSSCFEFNKIALKMEILCDENGPIACPPGGVGVYNPGFWGMNIQKGKVYKVILHVRSSEHINISVSLASSDGMEILASSRVIANASDVMDWKRVELSLVSKVTNTNSRIQLTSNNMGILWFDQVSVVPMDTYKGHGFRRDLFEMLANLKPRFLRFPGGSYVEGSRLINVFRWKATVGPWEERPGHFNDVWRYWTDDGLGYFEFLQLAEDLGAAPVWVFNSGISHDDEIDTANISPFVKDLLESIEFARGASSSRWGSVRAAMGHPEPFDLKYIAIGNQDCFKSNYIGNYKKFYSSVKAAYPDIKIITNCDASSGELDHSADLYDFHVYTSANGMPSMAHHFDHAPRVGPKAFVSEYAVTGWDVGRGNLLAALAQASFLIGLEKNSDVVQMASNAPLFVNDNDRRFNPDAIVFNSWQQYGTPTYWMQQLFRESSGANIFPITLLSDPSNSLTASAIKWHCPEDNVYFKVKVVNMLAKSVRIKISLICLNASINPLMSFKTVLTSSSQRDENSFGKPEKVVPKKVSLPNAGTEMDILLHAHSLTSFDFSLGPLTSSS